MGKLDGQVAEPNAMLVSEVLVRPGVGMSLGG